MNRIDSFTNLVLAALASREFHTPDRLPTAEDLDRISDPEDDEFLPELSD